MMTQRQAALKGIITDQMAAVAKQEGVTPEFIRDGIAKGTICIPANINHKNLVPRGVGEGLSTKVNANIGTSSAFPDPEPELKKLQAAIDAGADAVMDLSTGNNIDASRRHHRTFYHHGRDRTHLPGHCTGHQGPWQGYGNGQG